MRAILSPLSHISTQNTATLFHLQQRHRISRLIKRPDWPWGPSGLLFIWYWEFYPLK